MKKRLINETKILNSNNLEELIYGFTTKHEEGYVHSDIEKFLKKYSIDKDKFYDNLGINTCIMKGGETITFHCDVEKGVRLTIEERGVEPWEFD